MGFAELKARQRAAWGSAPWERFAETLAPLDDHLVDALAPRAGERWLDVATGTGANALRAARAGAAVTALDLSPELLQTATRLADEAGLAIRFDEGDCENLPRPCSSRRNISSSSGLDVREREAGLWRPALSGQEDDRERCRDDEPGQRRDHDRDDRELPALVVRRVPGRADHVPERLQRRACRQPDPA
jgi:SAM-dependent methyltransferase